MSDFTRYVGEQIRKYRKAGKLTLQDLADAIHKSRATVCKYENGEIAVDIETLYEISQVLQVSMTQLTAYLPESTKQVLSAPHRNQKSPFFQAQRLYFYFYDGRYQRTKDGIIDIYEKTGEPGKYEATLSICSVSANGRSSETFYTGKVLYSDMLIRFSFVNQYNPLEEDLLYIFNPLDLRDFTTGLLCGISSTDLMPCAFKCVITLKPQELTEEFRHQLLFTKKDLKRGEQLNMLLVDNMEK
ncbi:XRE family transcriptional regulator [bacterium 1XD42-54]|nr:XRE family transcriptional regulator [bacterium 1XD42-54]